MPPPDGDYAAIDAEAAAPYPVGGLDAPEHAAALYARTHYDYFVEKLTEDGFEEGWSAKWEANGGWQSVRLNVIRFGDCVDAVDWVESGADEPVAEGIVERIEELGNARLTTVNRAEGPPFSPFASLLFFHIGRDAVTVLVDGGDFDGVRAEAIRIGTSVFARAKLHWQGAAE